MVLPLRVVLFALLPARGSVLLTSLPCLLSSQELRRGWRILRQRLEITADPAKRRLQGRAVITVAVLNHQTVSIDVHLRNCSVTAVTVAGHAAPHEFNGPEIESSMLASVSTETQQHRVDYVRERQKDAAPAESPGELVVSLPPSVSADLIEALDALRPADGAAAVAAAAAAPSVPLTPHVERVEELPAIDVVIDYELYDQTGGVAFSNDPPVLVVEGKVGRARSWMPCVDTLNFCDRCPWDIIVSAPVDQLAVASGELLESRIVLDDTDVEMTGAEKGVPPSVERESADVPAPRRSRRSTEGSGCRDAPEVAEAESPLLTIPHKRFTYRVDMPVHAGDIALAVGPFLPLADPNNPLSVTHFCLPGRSRDLIHTVPKVFAQARAFCNDYFNADPPLNSFKQVFVGQGMVAVDGGDMWFKPRCAAGGLTILPDTLLHNRRCIDEGFVSRMSITAAVVSTYLGATIRARKSEDAWFVAGLAAHITALALTHVLGNNWYRLHIHDQIKMMAEESGECAPILAEVAKEPMFGVEMVTASVRRRAQMIVYLVERRVGFDVFRRALRDTLAETTRALANGNMQDDTVLGLDVGPFVKRLRAICGTDVRNLVKMWAASKGVPRIRFGYKYNARRHQAELAIEQQAVAHGEKLSREREGLLFQGSLTVRVMEPEGCVDHAVEVIDPVFVAELSCQCRRTKQKQATQAEKEAGEEPARIVPISWVRVDPDIEWCIDVSFIQPEPAWITMLESERDVVAQISSCRALGEYGTVTAAAALLASLENHELFWRVRVEAAHALGKCAGGLEQLFGYFRKRYTEGGFADAAGESGGKRVVADKKENENDVGVMSSLAANDFSDIGDYLVRRGIIKIVASIAGKDGGTEDVPPPGVAAFMASLLAENDNSRNKYDDDYYMSDLINAAGRVAVRCMKGGAVDRASGVIELVKRYQLLDELTPSRSGAVAAAIAGTLADYQIALLSQCGGKEQINGVVDRLLQCRLEPEPIIMGQILALSNVSRSLLERSTAYGTLARLYGGDLETVQWIISRADRTSTGDDVLLRSSHAKSSHVAMFVESRSVRRAALQALVDATAVTSWGGEAPILIALRRHTKRARQVCGRILRLAVTDADDGVRRIALNFAEKVWGLGIPVCLLTDREYKDEQRSARKRRDQLKKLQGVRGMQGPSSRDTSMKNAADGGGSPAPGKEKSKGSKSKGVGLSVAGSQPSVSSGGGGGKKKPGSSPSIVVPRSPNVGKASSKDAVKTGGSKKIRSPSERPKLGVPMSATLVSSGAVVASTEPMRDVNLKMVAEDREYLREAWAQMQRPKAKASSRTPSPFRSVAAPVVSHGVPAAPTTDKRGISTGTSGGRGVLDDFGSGMVRSSGAVSVVANGSRRSAEDEEERRRRKEERRVKKKRRREEEGRDGERKKKKKKKKRREDGGEEGVVEEDGFVAAESGGVAAFAGNSAPNGPVPTSEGSLRSDGKLATLKIKFSGATPKLSTS